MLSRQTVNSSARVARPAQHLNKALFSGTPLNAVHEGRPAARPATHEGRGSAMTTMSSETTANLTSAGKPAARPSTVTQRWASHATSSVTTNNGTTAAERARIIGSSWSRPHRPSQDAHDDVVPIYYIERRRQLDEISERKEAEGGLMAQLSAGILSEGIAAQTRVREEKVPVEVMDPDGTVRLPSGFEPPTPATDFHPMVAKSPADDHPIIASVKVSWDEVLSPSTSA